MKTQSLIEFRFKLAALALAAFGSLSINSFDQGGSRVTSSQVRAINSSDFSSIIPADDPVLRKPKHEEKKSKQRSEDPVPYK